MRMKELLHKIFDKASKIIDKRIHRTLIEAVATLSRSKQLSITGIGRTLDSDAYIKHSIKRIDRLFGNNTLHTKSVEYYQWMAQLLISIDA